MKSKLTSLENLKKEALKYGSRGDFKKGNPYLYSFARKNGLLDTICPHMKSKRGIADLSDKELISIARAFPSIMDLKKVNRGALRAIEYRDLKAEAYSHMENGGYTNYPWTNEELRLEALKYEYRGDFQKYGSDAYQVATRRGVLDEICSHMKDKYEYWDYEKLKKEASKYKHRVDFQKGSGGAYTGAINMGILDEICTHMEYIYYPWTNEELQEEAFKYEYRSDFYYGNMAAYSAASKRGILDEICKHMKPSATTSSMERELFGIIAKKFISAKKIRDRKVKIEDRPYIKGFEIDIYIPELKLGIEFDGRRWHSFETMRKDWFKRFWSDDDIRNYHEIKDTWFATKDIQILHIKEEDWRKNKQACVDRCLEFLKG